MVPGTDYSLTSRVRCPPRAWRSGRLAPIVPLAGRTTCEWREKPTEPGGRKKGVLHPSDEALRRSRGGLTRLTHISCDGRGRPLSVIVTPGQRHESTQLAHVLDAIRVAHPDGLPGRPRTRPDLLLVDRVYSFPGCRKLLKDRNIRHLIPERTDQRRRRASRPGRKPKFDREAYARRNMVERCVNKLKQ
jgi:transposase